MLATGTFIVQIVSYMGVVSFGSKLDLVSYIYTIAVRTRKRDRPNQRDDHMHKLELKMRI